MWRDLKRFNGFTIEVGEEGSYFILLMVTFTKI